MTPLSLDDPTGRYLSLTEREEIALLKAQDKGVREIARTIGRDPGTISRELRRNAATRGGKPEYRASVAQWKADLAARRPKTAKLVANPRLHTYVQERLSGQISRPDGTPITGPQSPKWTGRNKPHRKDRALRPSFGSCCTRRRAWARRGSAESWGSRISSSSSPAPSRMPSAGGRSVRPPPASCANG